MFRRSLVRIIGLGVLVIAVVGLAVATVQQASRHSELQNKLDATQASLSRIHLETLTAKKTALEAQLDENAAELADVQEVFKFPFGSINASSALFETARIFNVDVIDMTSTSPVTETLNGVELSSISLSANLEGDASDIIDFVTGMNLRLRTGTLKMVVIDIPPPNSGNSTTASISLVAYSYPEGR